jgi:hypothetical protein
VKTVELTDDNIEYAFEKLGAYAADYLRRDYDDEERDPRIVERELEAKIFAQRRPGPPYFGAAA